MAFHCHASLPTVIFSISAGPKIASCVHICHTNPNENDDKIRTCRPNLPKHQSEMRTMLLCAECSGEQVVSHWAHVLWQALFPRFDLQGLVNKYMKNELMNFDRSPVNSTQPKIAGTLELFPLQRDDPILGWQSTMSVAMYFSSSLLRAIVL